MARGAPHPHGAHGSFRGYVTGFVLSVILTAIPFWLVMGDVLQDTLWTSIVIMALAAVQIVVHMIYFLHMNTKSEGGWTFMALAFTLTLVVITLVGSIWVMYHLDQNMMPMTPHEALQKP
ncbi:cytochrome o ubiquinol oxidase subunit IV [Methylobacterium soli]|nr:cytochrome o ubiquinol oxidase subunit IV [Methylobacterium soli]